MAVHGSKWQKAMERKIPLPLQGTDRISLPHKVHDGKCADSLNMWVSPSGQFESRPGTAKLLTSSLSAPVKAITYYPAEDKLLIAAGGHLYLSDTETNSSPSDLGTLNNITDDNPVSIAIFCGDAYIASGGMLQVYDGASLSNVVSTSYSLPAPESSGCLAVRGDRLWVGQSGGSKVWHSGINDPLDWGRDPTSAEGEGEDLNGGSFNVDREDGGTISGLCNFAADLVIFKAGSRNSIHKVTGNTSGATGDISREQLAEGASALSPSLAAVIDRDILFAGVSGVQSLQITDQLGNIASVPVSLEMKPLYDAFSPQAMVFAPMLGIVFLVLDTNHILTYHRDREAWFPWQFSSFTPSHVSVVNDNVYFGSQDGQIYILDEALIDDDETPFTKNFTTAAMSFSASTRKLRMAWFYMTYDAPQGGVLSLDARLYYGSQYVKTENNVSDVYSNSEWDVSVWDSLESQWDGFSLSTARIRIGLQGDNIQLRLATIAPIRIYDMWCHGAYLSRRR